MKIIVPVDGSAFSLKAVETACDLAKAQTASLVLVAVSMLIPELGEGDYIAEKMKAQAEAALAKAKEASLAKGVTPSMLLASGASPADEIVRGTCGAGADGATGARGLVLEPQGRGMPERRCT